MPDRWLVIMVKVPRAGRVKTRLGRGIGMTAAAWWYRHQCARLLRRLRDPRWRIVLAVSPDGAGACDSVAGRCWPRDLRRHPQRRGDLGARMRRALNGPPPGPVVLIGSDIPDVTPTHIAQAFAALGGQDLVFGPAPDGGFWLVGQSRRRPAPRGFMRQVRWSGPHALADTQASWPGADVAHVDWLRDVDTVADLAGGQITGEITGDGARGLC